MILYKFETNVFIVLYKFYSKISDWAYSTRNKIQRRNLSKEESHVITVINPDILLKIVDILKETEVMRMQILILNLTRRSK